MDRGYQEKMEEVNAFFNRTASKKILRRPDGIAIVVHQFMNSSSRKSVVVCTGRAEAQVKYAEVAFDLFHAGFSVTIFDHRGQGFSDRQLQNSHPGHVRIFRDYVKDLEAVWKTATSEKPCAKHYLLAHSLGGLIALHFLLRNPDAATAAVLLAPLIEPSTPPLPAPVVRLTSRLGCLMGLGEEYFPGRGPFEPKVGFEKNDWCGCPERFAYYMDLRCKNPRINLGGPTLRWVSEIYRAIQSLRDRATEIRTPMLVCTAGSDSLVKTHMAHSLVNRLRCAQLKHFPTARHELLFEREEIRQRVLDLILNFMGFESAAC